MGPYATNALVELYCSCAQLYHNPLVHLQIMIPCSDHFATCPVVEDGMSRVSFILARKKHLPAARWCSRALLARFHAFLHSLFYQRSMSLRLGPLLFRRVANAL